MTLADKIQARRRDQVEHQVRDDTLHGRSHHPEIEADGADARRHGYAEHTCPYANTTALDGAGRVVTITQEQINKAAAWRRGWRA